MASLLNRVWSGLDFWDEEENRKQREQFAKQAKRPQSPVEVRPKPRQQVRAVEPKQSPYRKTGVNTSVTNLLSPTAQSQQVTPLDKAVSDSYGGGFTGISNRVRDVFDANTKADQIKRQAQSGLRETHAQQQERLKKQAIESSGRRNTANQFAGAGLKNVADRVGKLPGSIMQVQGRVAKSVNDIDNPVLRYGAKALTTPLGGLMTDEQANRSLRYGQQINKSIDNKLQQSSLGDRKDDNKWARMGGQMVTDLPLQIATGGAGLAALGTQMTADEANKAEAAGRTNTQSLGVGVLQGGASALSEKFGIDRFLPGKGAGGNILANALKRANTEGLQEVQQQFTQNLIANKAYDPSQSLKEGLAESYVMGGAAGGLMSPVADIQTKKPSPASNPVIEQAKQAVKQTVLPKARPEEARILSDYQDALLGNIKDLNLVNQIHREARAVGERLGIDVISGSNADIFDRINAVLENTEILNRQPAPEVPAPVVTGMPIEPKRMSRIQAIKQRIKENHERFKLDEGGYIQLGAPEPKKLSQDIKDQFSKQGGFGRDAMDRLEANKISKGDLERAGVIFDPKQVKKIAQILPEFKDNPVMTYRKGDYSYTDAGYGRYPVPQKARSGVLEFKHKNGVMRLNPEALFGEEMANQLARTAKDGELVDFTDTMKASGNRLFTYDQTPDKPLASVVQPTPKAPEPKPVMSIDPLESLKQEARKYKSAEEFIRAQGGPLYHATNNKFDVFDSKMIGSQTDDGIFGRGFYFANKAEGLGDVIRGGNAKHIMEVYSKHDNLLDLSKFKTAKELADYLGMSESSIFHQSDTFPRPTYNQIRQFTSLVKEKGHDGVYLPHNAKYQETVLFDPTKIKTKQQLTDIYNQALKESQPKAKNTIPPERGSFTKGEKVGFAGIMSPESEARTGTFVRQVDEHLAEVNYGDHTELNHVNNLYKLDQATQPTKGAIPERAQKVAEHAKQKAREVYENTGDVAQAKAEHNKVIDKAIELKKSKGVILADGKTKGGQRVQKVLRGPGESTVDLADADVRKNVERAVQAQNDEIADALGIPLEQRVPTAEGKSVNSTKKILRTAENESVKDVLDQREYGVKAIQNEPVNTFEGLYKKYLGHDTMSEAELSQSSRSGLSNVRDSLRKTNILRGANDMASRGLERASRGGRVSRAVARAAQYINKNAAQDPRMIEAAKKLSGDGVYQDSALLELGGKAYKLLPNQSSRARVHAVLDPEAAKGAVKYNDLTPSEKQAADMLRDIGDTINDTSFKAGMISRKKWESNRGGRYIARLYNEVATAEDVADLMDLPDSRGLFLGMYKSRVELNDKLRQQLIKDPIKLAVIRARQVRSNDALMSYMREADKAGYVKTKPAPGFIKISQEPNGRMHNWNGKYIRRDVYENINGYKAASQMANGLNNLLDIYDGNPLRRLRKRMLTIYNPVVRTGNVTSNYFFAYLNGVNPVTFQKNKLWANKAIKNGDPLLREAQKAGLIGNNIVSTDKNLFNKDQEFLRDVDRKAGIKNKLRSIDDKLTQRYGNADDVAKLAALKAHVDRGHSIKKAIEMTSRGFQDYSRVGHLYDMAAKSPVFGNAFVRFQGDLYTNILKNAAVDHPIRLASIPAATLVLGNVLSAISGESEEDKKTRESRAGAPVIPFTNISTEFQTPVGAVDLARFSPMYMRQGINDTEGNNIYDHLSRMLPFNIPNMGNLSKTELVKKAASDPLIGPILSVLGDTDWRGKSVADPEGIRDGKEVFPDEKLSTTDKNRNRLQYGIRNYAPYPFNEVGDILAAVNQNKRNEQAAAGTKYDPSKPGATLTEREGYNTSGSKKTVLQATGRLFGIRAQQYGKDEASEQRANNEMFKFFGEVDKFKNTLDTSTRQAFESRHKSNQTRSGLAKEFAEDPWYKYKNAGELLQNPALFEAEKKYAEIQNKYDGRPIDPIFNLPKEQRNIVLAKRLKLPGSKDEGFNTLYDQEWYQNFRKQQDDYYAAKDQYRERRGFAAPKDTNPYPEATPDVQKAMDYYFSLPSGTGARSSFIRNNPAVWNAITAQWDKQNAWTDEERKRLGLPAIDRTEDKKFASGGGGRRGGGGRGKSAVSIPDLSKLISGSTAMSKLVASTGDDLKIKQTAYKNLLKAGTSKKQKKQLAKASSRKGKA